MRKPQPWPIRLTHWLNIPLLAILGASGLQIFVAYPFQGPRAELYRGFPLQGWIPPTWLRLGDWLAGARHWHFAFAWWLGLNGLVYLVYLIASREWHRRWFLPWRDARGAVQTVRAYTRLSTPPQGRELYNGLQRLAYTSALLVGILQVLTGIALYKPVQFPNLTRALGGYDTARLLHFLGLGFFMFFTIGHVVMVALHRRSLPEMITGGKADE